MDVKLFIYENWTFLDFPFEIYETFLDSRMKKLFTNEKQEMIKNARTK